MKPILCVCRVARRRRQTGKSYSRSRERHLFLFTTEILRCIPIFEGMGWGSSGGGSRVGPSLESLLHQSQKSIPGSYFPTNTELRRIAVIYSSVAALSVRRARGGGGGGALRALSRGFPVASFILREPTVKSTQKLH